jgi:hypothetical protein
VVEAVQLLDQVNQVNQEDLVVVAVDVLQVTLDQEIHLLSVHLKVIQVEMVLLVVVMPMEAVAVAELVPVDLLEDQEQVTEETVLIYPHFLLLLEKAHQAL